MPAGDRIADVDAVPDDSTLLVTVADRESDEEREVVLVRTGDGVAAWFNYCQHWRDVNLDTGDGAAIRDDELVCKRHGATFESDSGECTFGPCEGAVLDELPVEIADGTVFLDDDGYGFVRVGASESGEDDDIHRSTESRIGF
ncbi:MULTISPECIES: Rieske (2Fe-2S) protein [Halolamina]|uniref:Ferredoxin subunit of nitrite reductase or a ring-hydroxylating dioxygenase n=1 Tax=Halolamina pelagica TaxID=699431 RepID=A0A1I5R3E1_9EURY|nr:MULTISPECIES: Rieske 2Fe-2S domain-containing protein [Halolamina]NHX35667.1 Rieske 2Fe-2S domain-containing protein [Halolamina sp. R1-12]SFP52890.1 Ferredoxin subunit of nitrite reductase or a ring-hydroxylating dioxygenase [Halolamina pelagica]